MKLLSQAAFLFLAMSVLLLCCLAFPMAGWPSLDVATGDTFFVVSWFHLICLAILVNIAWALVYFLLSQGSQAQLSNRIGRIHFWAATVCLSMVGLTLEALTHRYPRRFATIFDGRPSTSANIGTIGWTFTLDAALLVSLFIQFLFPIILAWNLHARKARP